jgi:hypothetical protein
LVIPYPIRAFGFRSGVEAVGLYSEVPESLLAAAGRDQYVYELDVPAGAAVMVPLTSGPPPDAGDDLLAAHSSQQDLLLPRGSMAGVTISDVWMYRAGTLPMLHRMPDIPLIGLPLAPLHRPLLVPKPAAGEPGSGSLEEISLRTAPGDVPVSVDRPKFQYAQRVDWAVKPLIGYHRSMPVTAAFGLGLWPSDVDNADLLEHLRRGGRGGTGLLDLYEAGPPHLPAAGDLVYAVMMPGGIDPRATLPLIGDASDGA